MTAGAVDRPMPREERTPPVSYPPGTLLTKRELAAYLRISERTLTRNRLYQRIPSIDVGFGQRWLIDTVIERLREWQR